MFKVKNKLSPSIMSDIFTMHKPLYTLRNNRCWKTTNINTVYYGSETLSYRGPKTWKMLPSSLKEMDSLNKFKLKPKECTYRICKPYIPGVGFLEQLV